MPPAQIFVSTRSRREYPRRRGHAQVVPLPVVLIVLLVVWTVVAILFWLGGLA